MMIDNKVLKIYKAQVTFQKNLTLEPPKEKSHTRDCCTQPGGGVVEVGHHVAEGTL